MQNTVSQTLFGVAGEATRIALGFILRAFGDRLSSQTINSAGLRIKGGSASPTVQTNAAYVGIANGKLVTKASATDLPALSGVVNNATFNVFAFYIDQTGTLTSQMGIAGSTLAKVVFPPTPENKAIVGFVIINPTGTGNFTGGTTALDDATVVPNAVFANTLGAFDPTVLI